MVSPSLVLDLLAVSYRVKIVQYVPVVRQSPAEL